MMFGTADTCREYTKGCTHRAGPSGWIKMIESKDRVDGFGRKNGSNNLTWIPKGLYVHSSSTEIGDLVAVSQTLFLRQMKNKSDWTI